MGSADYLALMLADARLPTGAHTQSAGLEPAFLAGMALSEVEAYVHVRLRTVTEVEAAATVVARAGWMATEPSGRTAAMLAVDRAWRVRTASAALRSASDLLGRSYLRMTASVWDLDALTGDRDRRWCRAVVVGATAAALGLDPAATARVVAYEDVQMVVSAALKLRPFDPAEAVRWVARADDPVEALVERVSGYEHPDEIPAHAAPQLEGWAERHARAERRLFRA